MTTVVRVRAEPACEVHVGAGALELAARRVRDGDVLARDDGLPDEIGWLPTRAAITLPAGEAAKDWAGLDLVVRALAHEESDRSTTLFVVGGGAALDVGGLGAALYARGIDAVYCPTTLLAMVDASVGGKTAINLPEGKNLVGVVRQPRAVYADIELLATLSEEEYRSGLGEVVNTALIGGERMLATLERDARALTQRDAAALERTIASCVRVKARIVAADPLERGPRKRLNLGHTFAHAIEHAAGYGRVPHGIAVAVGLMLALELARATGRLRDPRLPARVRRLLRKLSLPTTLDELRAARRASLPASKLLAAMRRDKKSAASEPRFVLPLRAGSIAIGVACDEGVVRRALDA